MVKGWVQVKDRGRVKVKVKLKARATARVRFRFRVRRIESAPFEFQPQAYYFFGPWKRRIELTITDKTVTRQENYNKR